MGLFEPVGAPQRANLAELFDDVLFGSALAGDLLEDRPLLLGRIRSQDPQRVDPVEQQTFEVMVVLVLRVSRRRHVRRRFGVAHRRQSSACIRTCLNSARGLVFRKARSMRGFFKEFKDFISTGNMIELAVAVILGLAVKSVIDAFMSGVANPLIGAIFGKPNLDNFLTFTVRKGTTNQSTISFGVVLTQLISLIVVGFVLFLFVKAYNKIRSPMQAAPPGPSEIDLLTEIRDELRAPR